MHVKQHVQKHLAMVDDEAVILDAGTFRGLVVSSHGHWMGRQTLYNLKIYSSMDVLRMSGLTLIKSNG